MTGTAMIGTASISKDTTAPAAIPGATTNRDMARTVITGAAIMPTVTTGQGGIGRKIPMKKAVYGM